MNRTLNHIAFLIPSLDPDERLTAYLNALLEKGAEHIILINDGSKKENEHFFDEFADLPQVTVLKHAVNQGKGRGLKTGFNHILNNMPEICGVVTADSDGQHTPDDTFAVAYDLLENGEIVFGTRDFNDPSVPSKSKFGNKTTTMVFRLLYGKQVNDTQTGLRGLPREFLEDCMKLPGERFEYEIQMLIKIARDKREIRELTIKTVYDSKENHQTHFDPLRDSIRIYRVIFGQFFKFIISSLASSILDIAIFTVISALLKNLYYSTAILIATVVARVCSSLFNYRINKTSVFDSKNSGNGTLVRYYILCVCQMLTSWMLVSVLFGKLMISKTLLKIVVDSILFLISYQIQRNWVFRKEK